MRSLLDILGSAFGMAFLIVACLTVALWLTMGALLAMMLWMQ